MSEDKLYQLIQVIHIISTEHVWTVQRARLQFRSGICLQGLEKKWYAA